MRLYLVRHMQTPCSAAGLYCGNCQTSLTAAGHQMAQALARHLVSLPLQALYSSDLPRAQHSARPTAQLCGLPLHTLRGLRELDYGGWEGLTRAQVRAQGDAAYAAWERDPSHQAPPAGETTAAVAQRAQAAVAQVLQDHPDGEVCVISHKATIRLLLCRFLGMDINGYRSRLAQPLGGINVIDFLPQGPLLVRLGDVHYLNDALRAQALA
jgi:broad specificity phosphatase PhoE